MRSCRSRSLARALFLEADRVGFLRRTAVSTVSAGSWKNDLRQTDNRFLWELAASRSGGLVDGSVGELRQNDLAGRRNHPIGHRARCEIG